MSAITDIAKVATGWEYTVDVIEGHTYNVYDSDGVILEPLLTTSTFTVVTTATIPPMLAIEYAAQLLTVPRTQQALIARNRAKIQWLNMGADAYLVERQTTSGAWENVSVVSGGDMYLSYEYRHSPDEADTTYRVVPCEVQSFGELYTGDPVEIEIICVGLPAVPSVAISCAGGTLTVEAA